MKNLKKKKPAEDNGSDTDEDYGTFLMLSGWNADLD